MPEKKFCASPWIELVLGIDGVCRPCCRNGINLGNWRDTRFEDIWNSDTSKLMRKNIINGVFPNQLCRSCYENCTHASLKKLLAKPLQSFCLQLKQINPHGMMRLANLQCLFDKKKMDTQADEILETFFSILDLHSFVAKRENNEKHAIITKKIKTLGEIVEDFLSDSISPRHIGPVRQPNLIAICNARCVHCNGNFTDQIRKGMYLPSGKRIPYLSEIECMKTLQEPDSMVDFFMNGSEFLFYKHWKTTVKEIAKKNLIKIRLSTNGMLLSPKASDFLLDNNYIGKLNVSLDGGTEETINKIRGRVNFTVVRKNIYYFLSKSSSMGRNVPVSFSFVLCDYNYKEMKDIVQFAYDISKETNSPIPHIVIQPMELKGHSEYGKWLKLHHHERIGHNELIKSFKEMADVARVYQVNVIVFYLYMLEEFIKQDFPFPKYSFIETCENY